MDRYNLTGKLAFLEKSRNLYKLAFELDPKDYYAGINAATKSVLLGDLKLGSDLATQVEALVGRERSPETIGRPQEARDKVLAALVV